MTFSVFQVALLFTVPRSKTIKALTNCELNVLKKSSLDSVLEHFPQFTDRMTAIADVSCAVFTMKKLFENLFHIDTAVFTRNIFENVHRLVLKFLWAKLIFD